MRYVIAASLLAVSIATAAAAQDVPPENLAGTLAGFRVEGNLGWDKTHSLGESNDRFGYGGSAGFDGNLTNQIVIGPEVSYWRPSKNRNQTSVPGVNGGMVVHEGREMWAADIRVAYHVGPDLLVFGKGGYINQAQRSYFNAPADQQGYATRGRTDGYQFGGGVQFPPHDQFSFVPANVYLGAQYVYSGFNNHTRDEHAMAGIGFRFR